MKDSMKKNNTFKRVVAGALSVLTVAAYTLPANVGGVLTASNVLVASAAADCTVEVAEQGEDYTFEYDGTFWKNNNQLKDSSEATIKWSVNVPAGKTLNMSCYVSSESHYDNLYVTIKNLSGEIAEEETRSFNTYDDIEGGTIRLEAGQYEISAIYSKDSGTARNLDSALISFDEGDTFKKWVLLKGVSLDDIFVEGNVESAEYDTYYNENNNGTEKVYWLTGNNYTVHSLSPLYFEGVDYSEQLGTHQVNGKTYNYTYSITDVSELENISIYNSGVSGTDLYGALSCAPVKDEFIYDGEKLDVNDFTITLNTDNLNDEQKAMFNALRQSNDVQKWIVFDENDDGKSASYYWVDDEGKKHFDGGKSGYYVMYSPQYADQLFEKTGYDCITIRFNNVHIIRRDAYITPVPGQTKEYTEEVPEIQYTVEQANGDRGVIATDINQNFSSSIRVGEKRTDVDYVDYYDINKYSSVGSYSYYLKNSSDNDNVGNYNFVLDENADDFKIVPKDIAKVNFYADDADRLYTGDIMEPSFYLRDEELDRQLSSKEDFEIGGDYRKSSVGNYTIQAKGIGNYTGVVSAEWSIYKEDGYIEILEDSKVYDGKDITDMFELNDPDNEYEIRYRKRYTGDYLDEAPSNAGEYDVELWHDGDYLRSYGIDIKRKKLRSSDIKIEVAEDSSVLVDGDDWTYSPKVTVKMGDTVLTEGNQYDYVYDENGEQEYDEGGNTVYGNSDYWVNSVKTKLPGTYVIEVYGNNNFTGCVAKTWTVTKEEAKPELNANDAVIRMNANKAYIGVSYGIKVPDGWTTESYGILFCNDGKITNASDLRLGSTNASIQTKANKTGTNIFDKGQGVVAVGYAVVKDKAGNKTTLYTENIGGKVATITENAPVIRVNAKKLYVGVSYAIAPAEGLTTVNYGILYCNDGTITDPAQLTLDSTNTSVQKKENKTGSNFQDTGKGVVAVGYVTVKNSSGQQAVIYTGNIGGKAVNITENAPVPRTNAGKNYVGVSYAITANEGFETQSYGILYCNDGTITDPAQLTLDSTNTSIIKKEGKTGTNLQDTGKGVVAVGYNVVKNGAGQEAIIYTGNIGGKYADLIAN